MQFLRSIFLLIIIACYVSNTAAKSKTVKDQVVDSATHLKDNVVEGASHIKDTVSENVAAGAKVAVDAAKTASKWTGKLNDLKRGYSNYLSQFVEADGSK